MKWSSLALLLLSGCVTSEQARAPEPDPRKQVVEAIRQTCINSGYQPMTEAYALCAMRLYRLTIGSAGY